MQLRMKLPGNLKVVRARADPSMDFLPNRLSLQFMDALEISAKSRIRLRSDP